MIFEIILTIVVCIVAWLVGAWLNRKHKSKDYCEEQRRNHGAKTM